MLRSMSSLTFCAVAGIYFLSSQVLGLDKVIGESARRCGDESTASFCADTLEECLNSGRTVTGYCVHGQQNTGVCCMKGNKNVANPELAEEVSMDSGFKRPVINGALQTSYNKEANEDTILYPEDVYNIDYDDDDHPDDVTHGSPHSAQLKMAFSFELESESAENELAQTITANLRPRSLSDHHQVESPESTTGDSPEGNSSAEDPRSITVQRSILTDLKMNVYPNVNLTTVVQSVNTTVSTSTYLSKTIDITRMEVNLNASSYPNDTDMINMRNETLSMYNYTLFNSSASPQQAFLVGPVHKPKVISNSSTFELFPAISMYIHNPSNPNGHVQSFPNGCGQMSEDVHSVFRNPHFPLVDKKSMVCEYMIIPKPSFCALRIEFLEGIFAGRTSKGCTVDSVTVISSGDDFAPQCGILKGYQFTVNMKMGGPVTVIVTTQSPSHIWSIRTTQISCNPITTHFRGFHNCGVKNRKSHAAHHPKLISNISAKAFLKASMTKTDPTGSQYSSAMKNVLLVDETPLRLTKGHETSVNEYPWQALVLLSGKPICGATIINEFWLITAAKCLQTDGHVRLVNELTVNIGDHNLKSVDETSNRILKVAKIVLHHGFTDTIHDIALMRVSGRIPFGPTTRPVCLPKRSSVFPVHNHAICTGWGIREDSILSNVLLETTVQIRHDSACTTVWKEVLGMELASSFQKGFVLCGGGEDVGTCLWDKGAPLVTAVGGRYELVGLASMGFIRACSIPHLPVLMTKISPYIDWIAVNVAD